MNAQFEVSESDGQGWVSSGRNPQNGGQVEETGRKWFLLEESGRNWKLLEETGRN